MKSHKGFDSLVGIYDWMVSLVFGSTIRRAQIALVEQVADNKEWLIIGGGTGWILEEIFKVHQNASITYVEASQKMIDRAKKREVKGRVNYVLGSIDQLPEQVQYNVVLTAFFWDMFQTNQAIRIKSLINQKIKKDAIWLLADFKNTDIWWQKILVKTMYSFFRSTCRIEASELPDFDQIFNKEEHKVQFQQIYYYGMIESTAYTNII